MVNFGMSNMETIQRAVVIKPNVDNFEIALAKSLLVNIIMRNMEKKIVNFIFYRSNSDDIIEAYGTTNIRIMGKDANKIKPSCHRKNTTLFYDMEQEKWKAFRWENLIGILNY